MRSKMLLCLALFIAVAMGASQPAFADPGLSALFSAVQSGDLQTVRQSLDGGVEIDARDADGLTPLMAAAESGHVEIVRELLNRGADVNARIGFYGITALTLAGRHGSDSEIVALLVQAGATKDVHDDRSGIPVIVTELE